MPTQWKSHQSGCQTFRWCHTFRQIKIWDKHNLMDPVSSELSIIKGQSSFEVTQLTQKQFIWIHYSYSSLDITMLSLQTKYK